MCGSKTTLDLSISAFIYLILLSVTMRVRYIKCQDASRAQAMLHVACGQNYKIIRH